MADRRHAWPRTTLEPTRAFAARFSSADASHSKAFKLAESHNAMSTIRRYAADDAHVIYGTACDESLGDQLRVTVIATGLSSARKAQATPPLAVVSGPVQAVSPVPQPQRLTGTDNLPILNKVAQPATPAVGTQQATAHS